MRLVDSLYLVLNFKLPLLQLVDLHLNFLSYISHDLLLKMLVWAGLLVEVVSNHFDRVQKLHAAALVVLQLVQIHLDTCLQLLQILDFEQLLLSRSFILEQEPLRMQLGWDRHLVQFFHELPCFKLSSVELQNQHAG